MSFELKTLQRLKRGLFVRVTFVCVVGIVLLCGIWRYLQVVQYSKGGHARSGGSEERL